MRDAVMLTLQQMGQFVPKTLLVMFASISLTYVLIAKGLLAGLSRFSRPLTDRLGLPDTVIATSMIAFGSALTANAILSELYHKRQISEQDTFLGAILNGTSINIKEIFTYQLPIMLPLLGWLSGGIYLACFTTAAVIRYGFVLFQTRHNRLAHKFCANKQRGAVADASPVVHVTIGKQLRLFLKIASTYLLVTFGVMWMFNAGVGSLLEKMVAPINHMLQLPVVLAVPIAIFIFNPVAGAAAVGLLRSNGTVSDIDAVLAVIVGSLILLPLYGFRSGTIARTVSFFGPRLGLRISATSTMLALASRLIFLVLVMGYKLLLH